MYCARCLTTFQDDPPACPNLACKVDRPSEGWGVVLGPGQLLDRHYRIEKALAVGGAGITYLAQEVDAEGQPHPPDLAIKLLYRARATGQFLSRLANEARILQELDHPHIVRCLGFVHRAGQEPYLVTYFERGGSLSEHVQRHGPLQPEVAGQVLKQILKALEVAHEREVVHRDLKPDNVLLEHKVEADQVPHIRVADFGIAKVSGGVSSKLTRVGAFLGTPEYAAPEQFEGSTPSSATDVFAAGALFYFLLVGRPPFEFSQRHEIEQSYTEMLDQLPIRLPSGAQDSPSYMWAQMVLDGCMVAAPEGRATISDLLECLTQMGEHGVSVPLSTPPIIGQTEEASGVGSEQVEETMEPAAWRSRETAAIPAESLATPATSPRVKRGVSCGGLVMGAGAVMMTVMVLVGVAVAVGYGLLTSDSQLPETPVVAPEAGSLDFDPRLRKALQSAPKLARDKTPDGRALYASMQAIASEEASAWSRQCEVSGAIDMVWLVGRDGTVRHTEILAAGLPEQKKICLIEATRNLEVTSMRQGPLHVRLTVALP